MAKPKRRRKPVEIIREDVTPERARKNSFASAGMARKIIPEIERLLAQEVLSQREYEALAYYRDQASLAEQSPVKSCIDFSPKGGNGPGLSILSAMFETGRIERNMGELSRLARAVAVDDWSLDKWVEECFGQIADKPKRVSIAALELKFAAGYIVT